MIGRGSRAPFRAVLFDVDGTLVDSNDLHAEAWQRAIADAGVDLPVDHVRAQIGKGGDNLLPALLPAHFLEEHREGIEASRSELFTREYLPRVRPFPGVRPLLERLAGDGIAIILASSGTEEEVAHHLDSIGCKDLIAATTSKDDVAHSKPCPDIFAAALAKGGGLAPGDALVVGDSPYDMEAAGASGIAAIAVTCGGFAPDLLGAAGARAIFADPQDLLARYDCAFAAA